MGPVRASSSKPMIPARSPEPEPLAISRDLHSPEEMERLASELSLMASPGSAILLRGELGSGKSTFARAFIRALAPEGADFDIPSPTFTLVQAYQETRVPVAHIDLYRTNSPAEIDELGLDGLIAGHILLIEWPERLGLMRWPNVLALSITGTGTDRNVALAGEGTWAQALQRNEAIQEFIASGPWSGAERCFFEGDASTRRYESIRKDGSNVLLMDMPARPDGPPVKNGKSYSAIAHLAENIGAVIGINNQLFKTGYSAPQIHTFDVSAGLAIVEDLGREVFGRKIARGDDMRAPLMAAVELLADMAKRDWPAAVPTGDGGAHLVPVYSEEALLIETDLLPSWFWPHLRGEAASEQTRRDFAELWSKVLPLAAPPKPGWTLRDYHSPNLIWLPDRTGLRRVGIIDTQDCVQGHPAYDLVSLLQDARVDIASEAAGHLLDHYCGLRKGEAGFRREEFATAFAVLGAQRATKILGIFARLSKRDGKHGYLKHIPRVAAYLQRNLQHPELRQLRHWFESHLPAVLQIVPP